MAGNNNLNQQVSSRPAVCSRFSLISDTDTLSIVNTCRYRNLDFLSLVHVSGSAAVCTFVLDHLTGTVTLRTGLYISHHTEHGLLGIYHLAFPVAFRTGFRGSSRLRTRSVTGITGLLQVQIQLFFTAKDCFFKGNADGRPYIGTLHRAVVGSSSSAAAK